MNKLLNLVNSLNYIAENEESIEMPGSYMAFNLRYFSDDWSELYIGDILGFDFFEDSDLNNLQILLEIHKTVEEKLEELEYAKKVLEFAISEEKQKPEGKKHVECNSK